MIGDAEKEKSVKTRESAGPKLPAFFVLLKALGVEGREAFGGECGELAEKTRVHGRKIEAGFALHALLERGRDALEQARIHVNHQEMIADVALAQADARAPKRLAAEKEVPGFEGVARGAVADDAQGPGIRLENFLQRCEDLLKFRLAITCRCFLFCLGLLLGRHGRLPR